MRHCAGRYFAKRVPVAVGVAAPLLAQLQLIEPPAGTVELVASPNKAAPLDTVMLVGYSRGAIAAYETAARLKTACGKPVLVRWIGLFDAVATSIEDSLAIGTSGRDSIGTRCFHVVKSHEKLPFLATAPILSCQAKEIRADHLGLGQNADAVALLRADANTVVPGIFADTTRTLAATSGPAGKCSVNSDLRSCFKAGCSWNEARCEVARK